MSELIQLAELYALHADRRTAKGSDAARLAEGLLALSERYRTDGVAEIGAVNPNVASYCDHWEKRTEKAEELAIYRDGVVQGLEMRVRAAEAERDALAEWAKDVRGFLTWMDACGGHGHEEHDRMRVAIAKFNALQAKP